MDDRHNKQILLVDDHASILMLLGKILRRQGYHVLTLGIGSEGSFLEALDADAQNDHYTISHAQLQSGALPQALKERIRSCNAIVTDYNYSQGITGVDFMEQVRKIPGCSNTPVIVHSSTPKELLADEKQMLRAEAVGITREYVLSKDRGMELGAHLKQLLTASPAHQI